VEHNNINNNLNSHINVYLVSCLVEYGLGKLHEISTQWTVISVSVCVSFDVKIADHTLVKFLIVLYTMSYSTNVVIIYMNTIKTLYGDSKHLQDKSYTTSYSFVLHLTILSVAHISYQVI